MARNANKQVIPKNPRWPPGGHFESDHLHFQTHTRSIEYHLICEISKGFERDCGQKSDDTVSSPCAHLYLHLHHSWTKYAKESETLLSAKRLCWLFFLNLRSPPVGNFEFINSVFALNQSPSTGASYALDCRVIIWSKKSKMSKLAERHEIFQVLGWT